MESIHALINKINDLYELKKQSKTEVAVIFPQEGQEPELNTVFLRGLFQGGSDRKKNRPSVIEWQASCICPYPELGEMVFKISNKGENTQALLYWHLVKKDSITMLQNAKMRPEFFDVITSNQDLLYYLERYATRELKSFVDAKELPSKSRLVIIITPDNKIITN